MRLGGPDGFRVSVAGVQAVNMIVMKTTQIANRFNITASRQFKQTGSLQSSTCLFKKEQVKLLLQLPVKSSFRIRKIRLIKESY
jgi:hypothetical protein